MVLALGEPLFNPLGPATHSLSFYRRIAVCVHIQLPAFPRVPGGLGVSLLAVTAQCRRLY